MLDERRSAVLQALVEMHIRTGAPVSSRAIRDHASLNVSTATVRNDLAALEREGLVSQPHTSAGRVPTDRAYRYYVDHVSPPVLRSGVRSRIEQFFASVHRELDAFLQDTSDLLADLTHYPAVVLGPGMAAETIHGVHLVQLGPQTLLVIIISEAGRVAKELVRLSRTVTAPEVAAAEEVLDRQFVGKRIDQAVQAAQDEAARQARGIGEVVTAATDVARRTETSVHDIFVGGTSQLTSLWEDLRKVHRILEFLEREAVVLRLLEDADQGTLVRIGSELSLAPDVDLSLVAASYGGSEGAGGKVGVFGPRRMDYRRTIRVVEEVSEGLGDRLGS